MKYRIFALMLAALMLTGSAGSSSNDHTEENTKNTESTTEPYILTFTASTIDGEELTSDCFADSRLTMLNVWATYCNPCISEMPDLGELAAEYDPETFQLIGIISDVVEGDDASALEEAQDLIEQTGADYPHLLLNQELYINLVGGISAVPTTFFLNAEGELMGYLEGAMSKDNWIQIIEQLLAEME